MTDGEQELGQGAAGAVPGLPPLNVVVLGLPGAGKGTQGVQFAKRHGIPKISTGDMLRDAVARRTPLGLSVEATLASGQLVDDGTIVDLVRERLQQPDTRAGFLLDGFPRTVPQAEALESFLVGRGPLVVVYLEIDAAVIIERILSRRTCESCGQTDTGAHHSEYCASCSGTFVKRPDDEEHVVRARLAAYEANTKPLVEWYRAHAAFRTIDGGRSLAEVARAFDEAVAQAR